MSTVVGKAYTVKVNQAANAGLYIGVSNTLTPVGSSYTWANSNTAYATSAAAGTQTVSFVATATTTYFQMATAAAMTVNINSISCLAVAMDRSSLIGLNSALITGTVTRAAVATGADLAAYGGFSAANYLETPYSSGLDFGTGDWMFEAWVNPSACG